MKPIFRYLFIVLLLSLPAAGPLQAQYSKVPSDTARVQVRSLPAASLKKYRDDSEFNYSNQRPQGMSIWDRFWYWVFESINKVTGNKFWGALLKVLLWGICIFAFVYAILKFTGMSGIGLFTGSKKAEDLGYSVTEDNIYVINFNEAIASAIGQKNYRLAVRLLYLQTLRKLADQELIHWKLNKTNDAYAQELAGGSYYNGFNYLTYAYDYVWYGDFPVQEAQFTGLQQYFKTFQQQLPG